MKLLKTFLGFLLIVIHFGFSFSTKDVIDITITNVRNNNGKIQLQVYRDQATFSKETPYKIYYVSKADMKNNTLHYKISDLPEGTYGIAILDDENNNKEMDWSFIMMPKEGFGFSNYYHTPLSKPKFEKFKFYLNGTVNVSIKVRYM